MKFSARVVPAAIDAAGAGRTLLSSREAPAANTAAGAAPAENGPGAENVPAADAPRGGHWFVAAWAGVYVVCAAEAAFGGDPHFLWPSRLNETLAWVLGIFVLGKGFGSLRTGQWPFGLGTIDEGKPAFPGPGGAPEGPGGEGSGRDDQEAARRFEAACAVARGLGEFTKADVEKGTGFAHGTVGRLVDKMLEQRLAERIGRGRYRWIGGP